MSASMIAELVDERDEAVYHLKNLVNSIDNANDGTGSHMTVDRLSNDAKLWLKEYYGDDDE